MSRWVDDSSPLRVRWRCSALEKLHKDRGETEHQSPAGIEESLAHQAQHESKERERDYVEEIGLQTLNARPVALHHGTGGSDDALDGGVEELPEDDIEEGLRT